MPGCFRDYYDETLSYCLDDGNALIEGPARDWELPTVIMSEPAAYEGIPLPLADNLTETASAIAVLPFANLSSTTTVNTFRMVLRRNFLLSYPG